MAEEKYDYGMVGLGTMGANLVYNMCDHGFRVAGFDKNAEQVDTFVKNAEGRKVLGTTQLNDFVGALTPPRVILLLVPAGPVVDAVINELKPFLSKDDLIIDCGNSHFTDTDLRSQTLQQENINFMGIGISGGEEGARYGPSIMPGGSKEMYARVSKMMEAIAANVKGDPCVKYLGSGSAGHYVKMVHNGIEYGLMQLISETYHLLKEGGGLSNDELNKVFTRWNEGKLKSFLLEITCDILLKKDNLTSNYLLDMILDGAKQKGTGKWASQNALDLQVPIPLIDTAVAFRELSALKEERIAASEKLKAPANIPKPERERLIGILEDALYFSFITTYAQGIALLQAASAEYKYGLNMADIAGIWRGGCIIRADMLEKIREAFGKQTNLLNILSDDFFSGELIKSQSGIRYSLQIGILSGIPMPAFMSALSYYDSYRRNWLPANLIQAQRDYFGAHTYERIDRKGTFHTQWNQAKS